VNVAWGLLIELCSRARRHRDTGSRACGTRAQLRFFVFRQAVVQHIPCRGDTGRIRM